ncbi:MAG: hypothetical protein LV468_04165 [Candidatus Nitrosotenuis sp.]|nr:hypothetical protein [Candidatus Nitrosotenuis sp.]
MNSFRTNYAKRDWQKLGTAFAVYLLIIIPVTWIDVYYFLIPLIEILEIITEKGSENDSKLTKAAAEYLIDKMEEKYSPDDITIMVGFVMIGVMVGTLFFFIRVIVWAFMLSRWVYKKLKLEPSMKLVIIRNDKVWLEF